MKRVTALVLALCLMLVLFAGCSGGGSAKSDTIKIGVFEPASGDNGAGGKQETLGIQYANYIQPTVDVDGKTYKVELVIEDNESSNDKAVAAASALVNAKCSVVLGSYGSSVSIAGSDTFASAGIPVIGITCTNPQVTEGNTHYFRICYLDPFQGTVLANYAFNDLGVTTAYCLAKLGDDYSVGLCNYFKEAFEGLGGTVVFETFPEGNTDFTSYVANAKNAGAGVFFAPVSTEAAALIIDQAHAQNIGIPLLAGDTWDSNVILDAAKGKNVSIAVTTFYQEGGNPEFDKGIKEWLNAKGNEQYLANNNGNDEIAAVTAMGYDAYFVALEAIKAAKSTDPAKIMEALWGISYNGVSGLIEFNEIGDAKRDVAYVKSVNTETGKWEFVQIAKV
ncbi:MAG: ABC transporter substrate-binding protein [Oscillospiraceae bacterium]